MSGGAKLAVRVADVVKVNDLITRFRFVSQGGSPLPAFSGGAHVVVEMDDHGQRRLNPYSLMGDPEDTSGYSISVRRDDNGRGGSLYLHNHVRPGLEMVISHPLNLFPLDSRARKHLMIAGGIGITPFLAQIGQLARSGQRFELHYAARNRALAAYMTELQAAHGDRIHGYFDDEGMVIDLKSLLGRQPIGTHLYVCGPKGMLAWVRQSAEVAGWPVSAVHFEEFLAPGTGQVFRAELALSGKTVTVGTHQSLLEAIEAAGVDAPYLCRGGACGQCETAVLRCDGQLIHRDHWLTDEDHASGTRIMPCVSRFEGKTLILKR